jgi:cyclophilin family peptidyl-prolyl cis-trans isomerase
VPSSFLTWSLAALLSLSLVGCKGESTAEGGSDAAAAGGATADGTVKSPVSADAAPSTDGRIVRIETGKGTIRFRLYEKEAPVTTANFAGLVDKGFYNGLTFHRVEPGFVVQGGDPKGNGTGDAGTTIPLEVAPNLKHDGPGVVAMARSQAPNSASCQFYITLGAAPHLDGGYAIFGKVIEGQKVVDKIAVGDKMTKVTLEAAAAQK